MRRERDEQDQMLKTKRNVEAHARMQKKLDITAQCGSLTTWGKKAGGDTLDATLV